MHLTITDEILSFIIDAESYMDEHIWKLENKAAARKATPADMDLLDHYYAVGDGLDSMIVLIREGVFPRSLS